MADIEPPVNFGKLIMDRVTGNEEKEKPVVSGVVGNEGKDSAAEKLADRVVKDGQRQQRPSISDSDQ